MKKMRASLVQRVQARDGRTAWAMGNVQQLADGGVFVGWGTDGSFSEFGPRRRAPLRRALATAASTIAPSACQWSANPTGKPAIAVRQNGDGTMTVYASWNGATDVTTLAGLHRPAPEPHDASRRPAGTASRRR